MSTQKDYSNKGIVSQYSLDKILFSLFSIIFVLVIFLFGSIQPNYIQKVVLASIGAISLLYSIYLVHFKKTIQIKGTEYNRLLTFSLVISFLFILITFFGTNLVKDIGFATICLFFLGISLFLLLITNFFVKETTKMKKEDFEKFLEEGEKLMLYFDSVKMTATRLGGASFMPFNKVMITDRRIFVSSSILGASTFGGSVKVWYNENGFNPIFGFNATMGKYWVEDKKFCFTAGKFLTYKIYTEDPNKILKIVKKYKK